MGECETRTQGASIAALWARLRTQDRAAQRGRAARASFRKERLSKRGSLQEELRGEPETFFEADPGLPAKELARTHDVRPGVADVAGPLMLLVALDRAAEDGCDRVGELVDRGRASGRDVEHRAADAVRFRRQHVRLDDVLDVGEVASLLAVAVDRDRPSVRDRGDEARNDRRILRGRILVRAEDVEVPQRDG